MRALSMQHAASMKELGMQQHAACNKHETLYMQQHAVSIRALSICKGVKYLGV